MRMMVSRKKALRMRVLISVIGDYSPFIDEDPDQGQNAIDDYSLLPDEGSN
jgi:hypothetical protein